MSFSLIFLLALAAPSTQDRIGFDYLASLQAQVRADGTPRERALFLRSDEAGTTEVRAAAKAAPADALVQMAASTYGDDRLAWSRTEPANGLAWVAAVGEDEEPAAIDAAIARIADADLYDDHFVDAWLVYRDLFAKRAMPTALVTTSGHGDRRLAVDVMAMAYAAALPMRWMAVTHACDRARHPQAPEARFEDCARIGRALEHSGASVVSKRIGGSLVRRSGLQDHADREAQRVLDWKLQVAGELLDEKSSPRELAAYFDDLASTRDEVRAQELLLARHGVARQPPADFQGPK
jgi:hypothetical protein